jgi:hypothetical protein
MKNDLKICVQINNNTIYQFSGKIDEQLMIISANEIEKLLLDNGVAKDKIKNVFELFVETIQNILSYSYYSVSSKNYKEEIVCNFSLFYFTKDNTYILESCNLIMEKQKKVIEQKLEAIKNLDSVALRKMIRQKSRTREDSHAKGAGLGYMIMTRKSSAPIEVKFIPYKEGILKYQQRLFI